MNLRICIIGASGTGKTTLAKALAKELDVPHFDSDDYYHYPTDPPFQKQRTPEDRATLLTHDLNQTVSWVLSGGAALWDPRPKVGFTHVVFLYLPPLVRIQRLKTREEMLFGSRIQPGGDMASTHVDFMKWTQGYDDGTSEGTCTLQNHQNFLQSLRCPVIRFDEVLKTEEQVRRVLKMC